MTSSRTETESAEQALIRGRRAAFADQRRARIELQYGEVKAFDSEEYRRCIDAASGIMINNSAALIDLSDAARSTLAANIEAGFIEMAHRLLAGGRTR